VASSSRRRNQRDDFALVSTVNAKVLGIDSDDTVFGVDLAHPDQTQIGQVRFPIRNAFHFSKNRLRVERSRGPLRVLAARRMNFFKPVSCDRARSKCCRTSSPCEIPVRAEIFSIHAASFFGRRIVNGFREVLDFSLSFCLGHLAAWPAAFQVMFKNNAGSSLFELLHELFSKNFQSSIPFV